MFYLIEEFLVYEYYSIIKENTNKSIEAINYYISLT